MGLIRIGKTDLTPEDDEALTDDLWPNTEDLVGGYREPAEPDYKGHRSPRSLEAEFWQVLSIVDPLDLAFHLRKIFRARIILEKLLSMGRKAGNKSTIDGVQHAGEPMDQFCL